MSEPVRPVESHLSIGGLAVGVFEGDGSEPPVVLVHGGMDRASSFGRVIRRLEQVPVRRYDRRGYGKSDPGTATDLDGHIDDLLAVIGARPAVVFGHSIGGTIALAAGLAAPDRILAVGVYESPVPWLLGADGPLRSLEELAPEDAAERFMRTMVGDRVWERLPPSTRSARRREGPALQADAAIAETIRLDLGGWRRPLLVGVGSAAPTRRLREAEALATATGAEVVTVDGVGHGVHLEDPAATADLIRRVRTLATA